MQIGHYTRSERKNLYLNGGGLHQYAVFWPALYT